ncbi:hypothetical protein MRX96_036727 [Rhipicephalus microplus]
MTRITLYHVLGHSILFRNELADFLAALLARSGDPRQAPLTPGAVRSMLTKEQLLSWESNLRPSNTGTDLFNHLAALHEPKRVSFQASQPAPPEPLPFTSILTETPSPFYADCRRDVAAPNEATIERFPPHRVTKNTGLSTGQA